MAANKTRPYRLPPRSIVNTPTPGAGTVAGPKKSKQTVISLQVTKLALVCLMINDYLSVCLAGWLIGWKAGCMTAIRNQEHLSTIIATADSGCIPANVNPGRMRVSTRLDGTCSASYKI